MDSRDRINDPPVLETGRLSNQTMTEQNMHFGPEGTANMAASPGDCRYPKPMRNPAQPEVRLRRSHLSNQQESSGGQYTFPTPPPFPRSYFVELFEAMKREKKKTYHGLAKALICGIIQIFCGLAIACLHIVSVASEKGTIRLEVPGFTCGILYVVTGGFGCALYKHKIKSMVTVNLVLNLQSAVFNLSIMLYACYETYHWNSMQIGLRDDKAVAIYAFMLTLAILQQLTSIYASIFSGQILWYKEDQKKEPTHTDIGLSTLHVPQHDSYNSQPSPRPSPRPANYPVPYQNAMYSATEPPPPPAGPVTSDPGPPPMYTITPQN